MDIYKYQSLSFRNKALWELKKKENWLRPLLPFG